MRGLFSTIFLLLVALMIVTTEAGKNKKDKSKGSKGASDCTDWRFGNCVAKNGDCGPGQRDGTCDDQIKKVKCKVPCNWKKAFGADCKYKFGNWGECDPGTGMKIRTGTLVKPLYDGECQPTISAPKACSTKNKGKKGKGKGN
ncbi:midkine a isoform 2-T2 [Clarias gariepinus]|uniref:midkine a isoform X2 n=1 Tax=Clarias gariepinus TaxID=13013 RepID=UPI00234C1799|nr:midkine a isoform X2 [Clarias gariepinus]